MDKEKTGKLKLFFDKVFTDKKIIISSENSLKTIHIPRNYQIVLASIVGVFLLIFIIFFAFGLNLYGKVDKKQRKIDQMNQDSEFAKNEMKNMIQYMDEINNYFSKIKRASSSSKNMPKSNLLEQKDDLENGDSGDLVEQENEVIEKSNFDEKKKINNTKQQNVNLESSQSSQFDDLDLHGLIGVLVEKIDNWRQMVVERYYYIYSILERLGLSDCKDVSWFSKTLSKAEDAIERISSSGQATGSTIKRLKNRICANGVVQKISQSYLKIGKKNAKDDIEFIKNLSNLEDMILKIPIGLPIKNSFRMSSSFGYRKDPIYGNRKFHSGQDMSARYGSSIFSTGNGVVSRAGWFSGYGWCVDVEHDFGIMTRYGHLSAINVHVGQKVFANSLIGKEGNSGKSTGPHLHYEIRINNLAINPKSFMFVNR